VTIRPQEVFEIARYRDNPVYFFVEQLVIDTIEGIPLEMQEWIAQIVRTDVDHWRAKIKEVATLSDTFELAVLDLWYRNTEIAASRGELLSASDFACLFADHYFAEGSQVDLWEPGALEEAKSRIAAAQARESKQKV
jgi:hypothetical protein